MYFIHIRHIFTLLNMMVVADLDSPPSFFLFFYRLPFVLDKQSKMGDARGLPHCHDNQAFAETSAMPTLLQDYIWTCGGVERKKGDKDTC